MSIANIGKKTEVLDLTQALIYVDTIDGIEEGEEVVYKNGRRVLLGKEEDRLPKTAGLAPGEAKLMPFLVRVDGPGLYFISALFPSSPEEARAASVEFRRVGHNSEVAVWGAFTYVVVADELS